MKLRHALTVFAVTTIAYAGGPTLTANAEEVPCPTSEELQVSLDEADATADAAKQAFKDSRKPLGKQVKELRHELNGEMKSLRKELQALRKEIRKASSDEERAALKAAYEEARAQLKSADKLHDSKKALLVEIKAGRTEARKAWKTAKTALHDLRDLAEACEAPAEEPVDEPIDDEPVVTKPGSNA